VQVTHQLTRSVVVGKAYGTADAIERYGCGQLYHASLRGDTHHGATDHGVPRGSSRSDPPRELN